MDFGQGPVKSAGSDIIVAKYSGRDGAHLWSRVFGGPHDDSAESVAVDANGNVFVAGRVGREASLGGRPGWFGGVFIAKYSAGGAHLWSTQAGGGPGSTALSVALDRSGDVVVTGQFRGSLDFGRSELPSIGNNDNIFVAKLSGATGSHVWSRRFGASGDGRRTAVAVDASGDILLTGFSGGGTNFGQGPVGRGAFLAKCAGADGSPLWSRSLGGRESQGHAVAVDLNARAVVTGRFDGSLRPDPRTELRSLGSNDIFVATFSGDDGTHIWSRRFGGLADDEGNAVAIDPSGNVLVTGRFRGDIDLGDEVLSSAGGSDVFVAKLARSDGSHIKFRRVGDAGEDQGLSIAVDSAGVFVAGTFSGTVDFGQGPLRASSLDAFLAKLRP